MVLGTLKTYPDVAWGFHALFDDPFIPGYYIHGNTKTIETVKGLDDELDWLSDSPILDMFSVTPFSEKIGSGFVKNFIINMIKDIAERYELGFTAYYDFDKEGKNNAQQIDYAKIYPEVFKGMIAGYNTPQN